MGLASGVNRELMDNLKGADACLLAACRAVGLRLELRAVFNIQKDLDEDLYFEPEEEEDPIEDPAMEKFHKKLYTTKSFGEYEDVYAEDEPIYLRIEETADRSGQETIWIVEPQHYTTVSPYTTYGNQAVLDYVYSAVALFVYAKSKNARK